MIEIIIIAASVLTLNGLVIGILYNRSNNSKIEELKKSKLNEILNKVMDDFKNDIKIEHLTDKRIKLNFPKSIIDKEIFFYLNETMEGNITVSDYGEMISQIDMDKSINKQAVKKACDTFGIEYIPTMKSLEVTTTQDKLDETIWNMFSALLVMEYVRYR